MTPYTLNLSYDRFDCPVARSKTTAFGKRGFTGGVEVLFSSIPERVLQELLIEAITARMHKAVDKLPKATATVEEVRACLSVALSTLQSGTGPAKGVKDNSREKAKTILKSILRENVKAATGAAPDNKDVTKQVAEVFKAHTAYVKAKTDGERAAYEASYKWAEHAMSMARTQIAEAAKLQASVLADLGITPAAPAKAAPKPATKAAPAKKRQAAASGNQSAPMAR